MAEKSVQEIAAVPTIMGAVKPIDRTVSSIPAMGMTARDLLSEVNPAVDGPNRQVREPQGTSEITVKL